MWAFEERPKTLRIAEPNLARSLWPEARHCDGEDPPLLKYEAADTMGRSVVIHGTQDKLVCDQRL
jgi:hypothetical protein